MHGLEPTPDSELNRLKRYESGCLRRMQWAYTKLMARKRSQWPSPPAQACETAPVAMPRSAASEPTLPAEPEPETAPMPEDIGALAEVVDAVMEPETSDPYIVFNYMKQLELTAVAQAKHAAAALAEAAAPPVAPVPPKPSAEVHPAPVFPGNRRARRAAARKARQSG